jgi:hypothetical protein
MRAMMRLAPRISRLARHTSGHFPFSVTPPETLLALKPCARLGAQRAFKARNSHEEDLEVVVRRHRAIAGRAAADEVILGGGHYQFATSPACRAPSGRNTRHPVGRTYSSGVGGSTHMPY